MNVTLAINTLAFHGYPLDTAMHEIACLAEYVEPVFISKYDPSLSEDYFNDDNAQSLRTRIEGLHLKVMAMASDMDMGQPDSVSVFTRRMKFAKAIGARIILTNASIKSRESAFYNNIESLAAYAAELNLMITLENPGDGHDHLLGTGTEGIALLDKLESPHVKLNYDCSNVFTYSKGTKRPEQEIELLLPYIGHLHLKNVKRHLGEWYVCGLGEGIIGYQNLFRQYPALCRIPMSIELPIRFGYDAEFNFVLRQKTAPPMEGSRRVLSDSIDWLNSCS